MLKVPPGIQKFEVKNVKQSSLNKESDLYDIRLNCKVESNPRPGIKWFYDGNEINEKSRFKHEILETSSKNYIYFSTILIKVTFFSFILFPS